jgi:hypothetical protein
LHKTKDQAQDEEAVHTCEEEEPTLF